MYLLILTWLRQLQEYFYNFEGGGDSAGDWNRYRKYYGTPTPMKDAPLANINMAQKSGECTAVIGVVFFEPDHRDGVCVSLEEWAARIFKPNSAGILRDDAKLECKNTKHCFKHSKKVTRFFFIFTEVKGVHDKKKKYKIVQVWRHLSKVYQIVTKDSQDKSCHTISVVVLNSF